MLLPDLLAPALLEVGSRILGVERRIYAHNALGRTLSGLTWMRGPLICAAPIGAEGNMLKISGNSGRSTGQPLSAIGFGKFSLFNSLLF
jgi:hypothetical protein